MSASDKANSGALKFFHLRQPLVELHVDGVVTGRHWPCGGLTIAYRCTPRAGDPGVVQVEFAVARCRTDERYVRRVGRDVAVKHLLEGNSGIMLMMAEQNVYEVLLEYVLGSGRLRRCVRAVTRYKGRMKAMPECRKTGDALGQLGDMLRQAGFEVLA